MPRGRLFLRRLLSPPAARRAAKPRPSPKIWEDAAGFKAALRSKFRRRRAVDAAARGPAGLQARVRAGRRQLQGLPRDLPAAVELDGQCCDKAAARPCVVVLVVGGSRPRLVPDCAHRARCRRRLPPHRRRRGDANGERIFYAGGCASCHAAPEREGRGEAEARRRAGAEDADFGIFRARTSRPTPKTGIGGWSTLDFVNAVMRGVSPGGAHLLSGIPLPLLRPHAGRET